MAEAVKLVGRIKNLHVETGKEGEKHRDLKLLLTEAPASLDELESLMDETLVIALSKMQTEMFDSTPDAPKRSARRKGSGNKRQKLKG